jgi:NAD(P)-dependent dehydrogenase (short-subunit alcohol dehydrogenase family)
MRLKDKVAVVTGGARGIGAAIARAYIAEGARVIIADVETDAASALAVELGGGAKAIYLDVRDEQSIRSMVAETEQSFGRIDILVNNAGVFDMAPLTEISNDMYRRQFDINVGGLIFVTKYVAESMRAGGKGGAIINMSSQAGRRGEANVILYCAAKAAVISITQSMALELIKFGIRVNAIAPGVVDTPMWDRVDSLFAKYEGRPIGEKKRLVGEAVPAGRMGVPEDMAGPAVFLASDEARYVLAQTLNVDGGNWMS